MATWLVTIKPKHAPEAWPLCTSQGVVLIGWGERRLDDDPVVRRFRQIELGDWIVAHVPESHGGGAATALGIGRVIGPYQEVPRLNPPAGRPPGLFWRQYAVEWTLGRFDLNLVKVGMRHSVLRLKSAAEGLILRGYGLDGGGGDGESPIRSSDETVAASALADNRVSPKTLPSAPIAPPIAGAESLIARIRQLPGLPERNHEDVVKDLLIGLGFDSSAIVFQAGRIDVCVFDANKKAVAVFEVKRTIAAPSKHDSALRQGMDYAMRNGASIVVITDGDRYAIYDRRKGSDYDAMRCGSFQLSAFRPEDSQILDLLRPPSLKR